MAREKRSVGDPIKKSCVKECRVDIVAWEDTDTGRQRIPYATCRHVTTIKRESRIGVKGEWFPSSFMFFIKGFNVEIERQKNHVKGAEESMGGKGPIMWVRRKSPTKFNRQCNKKHEK